jgi:hypothetical protein
MAALTWVTLQNELTMAIVRTMPTFEQVPPDFLVLYPSATSYAEGRICAEIPLLANRTSNSQLVTASGSRLLNLSLMTAPLVVMETLALVTPANTQPASGVRYQYVKTTLEFISLFWPNESSTMGPAAAEQAGRFWAPLNTGATPGAYTGSSSFVAIAPTPDQTYVAECTGLFQPVPISFANPTTYISTVYPDLLVAGCMVYLSASLLKDANQVKNWEAIYESLKNACEFEEARRRGLTPNNPRPPAPVTAP